MKYEEHVTDKYQLALTGAISLRRHLQWFQDEEVLVGEVTKLINALEERLRMRKGGNARARNGEPNLRRIR